MTWCAHLHYSQSMPTMIKIIMSNLKPLIDILGHDDETQELYTSDQKKRYFRSQKGPYSRQKGLFNFLQLIKEWEVIVGKLMAQNTVPLKIKNKILYISTKHSIFAQELGFLSPEILQKIKKQYPELEQQVQKIKFVHSNFSAEQFSSEKVQAKKQTQKRKTLHPYSPEYRARQAKAQKMFEHIDDPEIKKILCDFMLTCK